MDRLLHRTLLALALIVLSSGCLSAQASGGRRLSGIVVGAETMQPLGWAQLTLEPVGAPGARARDATADSAGRYVFPRLAPGRYRVRAQSIGYRSASVEVEIAGTADVALLSIGLEVQPIALEPIAVRPTGRVATFDQRMQDQPDAEVQLERIRHERWLEGDTRLLSFQSTREMPVLGEPDLLRALERLPGVSTRDEYTTELWVRGAAWSRTAVFFDGMPLFSAMHAAGAVSAISADIVGDASLHPGVQQAGPYAGTAAALAIETRAPEQSRASAELTALRGSLSAEGRVGARGDWIVAVRRSHLDLLPRGLSVLHDGPADRVPYFFGDAAARVSASLAGAARVELSGLIEQDRLDGSIADLVSADDATRGSAAARVSVLTALGTGELRATVGYSRFAVTSASGDSLWDPARQGTVRLPGLDNAIAARIAELQWSRGHGTRAGLRFTRIDARMWTDGVWPYREADGPFSQSGRVEYATAWAQHRVRVAGGLVLEPGVTVDVGADPRIAPRISARLPLSARTSLSAGTSRSHQYARPLVPAGAGFHRIAYGDLFWLAGDDIAPLRADIATIGVEHWLMSDVLASVAAYRRSATGVSVPSVEFGSLQGAPALITTLESARGVEAYMRKLGGRWAGSLGYAWAIAELASSDTAARFAAPFDRRHTFDAALAARLPYSLRGSVAYTLASGAPYTRFLAPGAYCTTPDDCDSVAPGQRRPSDPGRAHQPSAQRGSWYRSLDLSLSWSGRIGAIRADVFGQLHNVLRQSNSAAYRSSGVFMPDCPDAECADSPAQFVDQRLPGLPRVPSLGLRLWF